MQLVIFLTQLLISGIEAVLIILLGLQMLKIKLSVKEIILIGLSQGIFGGLIDLLNFPFGIHTLIQFVLFILVLSLVSLISLQTSFIAILLGFGIYISVEAIWFPLLLKLSGTSLTEVQSNHVLKFGFFLTVVAVVAVVILFFYRYKISLIRYFGAGTKLRSIDDGNKVKFDRAYPLIVLLLVQNLFIVLFYSINYASANSPQFTKTLMSNPYVSIAIIFLLTFSAINMVKRVITQVSKDIELEVQMNSLKHVKELVDNIRTQRHDFSHHVQTIYGLIEVGAFNEASGYIKGIMKDVTQTSELVKTDSLGLTALLYTKMGSAEANKIDFSIDIRTSLKGLIISDSELNAMLGNLIDNAFHAVKNLRAVGPRRVDLVIEQDLDGYVFRVTNTGPPIDAAIKEKMFEPGFTTREGGKGMGLYSVNQLVRKYAGKITVISDQGLTSFSITLPSGGK